MGRRTILTREVLAGIPALVEQGLRKGDIAERLGCKEATLVVRCSMAGISLRGPKRFKLRDGVPLRLSRETIASLSMRAAANGRSEANSRAISSKQSRVIVSTMPYSIQSSCSQRIDIF